MSDDPGIIGIIEVTLPVSDFGEEIVFQYKDGSEEVLDAYVKVTFIERIVADSSFRDLAYRILSRKKRSLFVTVKRNKARKKTPHWRALRHQKRRRQKRKQAKKNFRPKPSR